MLKLTSKGAVRFSWADDSMEGGLAYQILLSGDAEAIAEDGYLKIRHAGPVLGIVRVQPVQTEAAG